MSTNDTWILVAVPRSGGAGTTPARRVAARVGLLLLAWADRRRSRPSRSVDPARVRPAAVLPRPFC